MVAAPGDGIIPNFLTRRYEWMGTTAAPRLYATLKPDNRISGTESLLLSGASRKSNSALLLRKLGARGDDARGSCKVLGYAPS